MQKVKFTTGLIAARIEKAIIQKYGSLEKFISTKIVSRPTLDRAKKGDMTFATLHKLETSLGITFDDLIEGV